MKIEQPTLKTWIEKTQVMTMLTQTRDKKNIHPKQCAEMIQPRQKLEEQWEKRHNEIQKIKGKRRIK